MNAFKRSISQIFKGAVRAFQTFPASIAFALAFSVVTMIRIQLDWPAQEAYNFLFNCLHWSFALGAVFSLTAITAAHSRFNESKAFLMANLLGVAVVAVTFLMLYYLGGTDTTEVTSRIVRVSGLAAARVGVAILVSFLSFIILAGNPKDQSDFARSFFMTHKAFFIALIYGAVIMAGASGVAGAIQALLYRQMSGKVYQYIATLVGFLAFTIFVGFFPDFRKGQIDEKREAAQKQPRFVEILFTNIMIPIVMALTVVLLIWTAKTTLTGTGTSFVQLSGIATSYAVGGIWLHIMVTHHEAKMAQFYRRIYPYTALIILAFEARALLIQLSKSGLKMTEYSFIIIWIIAVAAAVMLIILKAKSHKLIVTLACVLAVFSVLPVVGYHSLPVTSQANRLEKLLVSQGMLKDNQLIPASSEPELTVRESITDSVNYLAYAENAKLPSWFDTSLSQSTTFKTKMGFEQTWPKPEEIFPGGNGISMMLPSQAIDISAYHWVVNMLNFEGKDGTATTTVQGEKGLYQIQWTMNPPSGVPILKIKLDDRTILEQDMNAYIDEITMAFPLGQARSVNATIEDMSLKLDTPEISVLLVFNNIDINVDAQNDVINYWFNLNAIYMKEN